MDTQSAPKVSVIVPVYNVEKYIRRCLRSLLDQTYSDLEIILVNDCTPDNSMLIVNEYAVIDNRIKIINLDVNHGPMRVRDIGVKHTTGDYIVFCDSDDWMPKDAISILLSKACEADADIVVGAYERVDSTGRRKAARKPKLNYGYDSYSMCKSMLSNEMSHSLWGKIYKSTLLRGKNYLIYDNFTNSEDKLLQYQIVDFVKNVQVVDDVVYFYCVNEFSSTMNKALFVSNNSISDMQIVFNYMIDKFKNDPQMLFLLERNIVSFSVNLARNKFVNPIRFLEGVNLLNKMNLLSFSKMKYYFHGKTLIYNYFFARLSICKSRYFDC